MARRRRSSDKKITVEYRDGATRVEYVPRAENELRPELARVSSEIRSALRILSRLDRYRHIAIVTARFQLMNVLRAVPVDASSDWLASEIARLSIVMEDTLALLGRLKHSRIPFLEEARFRLTYGQSPKKKESATSFTGKRKHGRLDMDDEWGPGEEW